VRAEVARPARRIAAIWASSALASTPQVDPTLASVVTGGYWESGGLHGTYRVLLFRGGFEHVTSTAVAEWISDPPTQTAPQIIHTKVLFDSCLCSLDPPKLTPTSKGARATLTGELTAFPGKTLTCKFDLSRDGYATAITKC
jgi:hypothetical protein